ncbi:hypothetical protein [Aquimonas sp.]|jgi:hypothetical protein|uniref:hypothetical protein n=1 Tax=Aquimonas sp. TaxID=1872588 RepID=UPI0037C043D0
MKRLPLFAALMTAGCLIAACSPAAPPMPDLQGRYSDSFDGSGELTGWTAARAQALPEVGRVDGRYRAALHHNRDDVTLHYKDRQGRLDAKPLRFPFEVIVRNIGIGGLQDSQQPHPAQAWAYNFAGLQVHVPDFDDTNSAHLVVGHRGETAFTVEGKNTRNGHSEVSDEGANVAPQARADLRIVGLADRSLRAYWQLPNPAPGQQADDWKPYGGDGLLPGRAARYPEWVYVGLITYAQGDKGLPFVGTADAIELVGEPTTE